MSKTIKKGEEKAESGRQISGLSKTYPARMPNVETCTLYLDPFIQPF
jgi:hypothetical protein